MQKRIPFMFKSFRLLILLRFDKHKDLRSNNMGGDIETEEKDSKHCSQNILIKRELSAKEFHSICIKFLIEENKGYYSAQNASSGNYAKNASSGDFTSSIVTGKNSVDANIGKNGKIMGIIGTWITLAEYDSNNKCIIVKSSKIDGKKLKENTFYTLKNKKFTEVK